MGAWAYRLIWCEAERRLASLTVSILLGWPSRPPAGQRQVVG